MTENSSTSLLGRNDIIDRLLLNDDDKHKIVISPILSSNQIQPASLEVRLGSDFLIIKIGKITHLDPLKRKGKVAFEVEKYTDRYKILDKKEKFVLHPNEFILGCTLEYIKLPTDIAARVEGRSSWGRLGILVHSTAGFIDPGFCGNITFELKNMGKAPIPLYPGISMAQLSFFKINNDIPYSGKYNESFGVVPSKYFEDFEYDEIRKPCEPESLEQKFLHIFELIKDKKEIKSEEIPDCVSREILNAIEFAYRQREDDSEESTPDLHDIR